jgi:hypothetical protein
VASGESLFDRGSQEGLKLAAHASLGTLALACLAYNAIAFVRRGDRHLAANTVLYAVLVALEVRKVGHHCG